jgi:hypothetical protein
MNDLKDIYYIVLGSVFTVGLILGGIIYALLAEQCKPREVLCKADIVLNNTLKDTLSKQETLCIQKIDSSVKASLKNQTQRFDLKFKRLEDACNQLDCAQCKR